MKKIAIDCRSLAWKHSGIARYLDNILICLAALDKTNEYLLLTPFSEVLPYTFTHGKIRHIIGNEFVYKYLKTPKILKEEKVDIYWSPTQELPLQKVPDCKYIVTIHDAAIGHDMSPYGWKVRLLYYFGFYRRSAKIADLILTDSVFSQKDIARVYGVDKAKIQVTYIGKDDRFQMIPQQQAKKYIKKQLSFTGKYIFYVNTGRPKNLLLAFKKLIHEKAYQDITLICLGRSATKEQDMGSLIHAFSLQNNVLFIKNFVSDTNLNNLYAGSEFFVCPSFFEGFGLTPLEALASGTSILISNVSALPEVFGNSAVYCDPYDVDDIYQKMRLMLTDKTIKLYNDKERQKVLKKFSWDKISRQIYQVFQ